MEETEFLEQRAERNKRFQQKIEELRTQDADDFNKSKISLEKSIQVLNLIGLTSVTLILGIGTAFRENDGNVSAE
jgi:hypothetical protein